MVDLSEQNQLLSIMVEQALSDDSDDSYTVTSNQSYLNYMKKIVLDLNALRAEIGIWQDSADDSFKKYSNEKADQKKKKEYWDDY